MNFSPNLTAERKLNPDVLRLDNSHKTPVVFFLLIQGKRMTFFLTFQIFFLFFKILNKIFFIFSFNICSRAPNCTSTSERISRKLDPLGSTVRYEMMKLCTGSELDSNSWYLAVLSHYEAVIEAFESVEGINAFIH